MVVGAFGRWRAAMEAWEVAKDRIAAAVVAFCWISCWRRKAVSMPEVLTLL